jgi:hypothetical protein
MATRNPITTAFLISALLVACAGPEPVPEPGMKVIQHAWGEEMQVISGVDWNSYTRIILHDAPAEFREGWQRDQERKYGRKIRESDMELIKEAVSGRLTRAMYEAFSASGDYEFTSEAGPGVMRFNPNIVDLDAESLAWGQSGIVESLPISRGSMTVELVIRDSVSDQVLAVAWRRQSDPRWADTDTTVNASNSVVFRLMAEDWSRWLLKQLAKT